MEDQRRGLARRQIYAARVVAAQAREKIGCPLPAPVGLRLRDEIELARELAHPHACSPDLGLPRGPAGHRGPHLVGERPQADGLGT